MDKNKFAVNANFSALILVPSAGTNFLHKSDLDRISTVLTFGGVAQWLGRRSLTGGLSLICA